MHIHELELRFEVEERRAEGHVSRLAGRFIAQAAEHHADRVAFQHSACVRISSPRPAPESAVPGKLLHWWKIAAMGGRRATGWGSGFLGVIIFSGSLPATRIAVGDIPPLFLTSARAVIAALLGAAFLLAFRGSTPRRADLKPLAIVAAGVVVGFPLLTGFALQHITAAHSVVFIGVLPLLTAIFAVMRGGERPKPAFWLYSAMGAAAVAGYALYQSGGGSRIGDLLMVAAVLLCALGYAEGANLSRRLGGWQVIIWALLLSLPVMSLVAFLTLPDDWGAIDMPAWLGLGYVSVFSMLVGFIFWYRGLAIGGTAGVSQLQLLQPFVGLALAWLLLDESVAPVMIASAVVVVLCVAGAKRAA